MTRTRGPKEWVELVEVARISNDGFVELIGIIRPVLLPIARRLHSRRYEDLVQAGLIKIWQSLKNVDLARPDTIRKVVIEIGVYGMRDELRKIIRRHKKEIPGGIDQDVVDPHTERRDGDGESVVFDGLLAVYLDYVSETGSFVGAHQHVSKLMGTKMHLTRKRFHQAVKKYIEGNGK